MTSEDHDKSEIGGQLVNSAEFFLLRPLCVAVIQEPSEEHLETFQQGFQLLTNNPPQHLAEYVTFPFLLHLRRWSKLRDKIKTKLVVCMTKVLEKFPVKSCDMFIEIFQRLHIAIGTPTDPTKVNLAIPEDQLETIISCIKVLCERNMSMHFRTLFEESHIRILAHSIFVVLQVSNLETSKLTRLMSLDIIHLYVSYGYDKPTEAGKLFKFLPGIISSVRKIIVTRSGRLQTEIFLKGIKVLEQVISVTTMFETETDLMQPDVHLSVVLSEISQEVLRNDNIIFRQTLLDVSAKLLPVVASKMPNTRDVLLNNVMILRSDSDVKIVKKAAQTLSDHSSYIQIKYEDVLGMIKTALLQLKGNDESAFVSTLAKLCSCLEYLRFNFYELKEFLNALFCVICEVNSVQQFSVNVGGDVRSNPMRTMCYNICSHILSCGDVNDVREVFESELLGFDGELSNNFLGCVLCFNEILHSVLNQSTIACDKSEQHFTEFDILQFAQHYMTILDVQSTEIVLNVLATEAPKTQSLVDVRKAALLHGIGLMAKLFPSDIIPVVLYTIVEYAGADSSPIINETARRTLSDLSNPSSVQDFLLKNLSTIMNDLNIRILNLSLHPNSPNALIFLAEFFDFSQTMLVNLVDQVLSRSCDPFSGSNMQHLYSKVFYAFVLSLWSRQKEGNPTFNNDKKVSSFLSHTRIQKKTFFGFVKDHQTSLGLSPEDAEPTNVPISPETEDSGNNKKSELEDSSFSNSPKLTAELNLVNKICHRVLNFLPNPDRTVRLLSMDCLIKGIFILKAEEDTVLPLTHVTWQNLVPRIMEKDSVVVRKSFELLLCLCSITGTFVKKRTLEEIFPKVALILSNLAIESESIKEKNRKYYTYTQAYKLQLTVLQGMAEICQAIDVQEDELHKVVDGCLLYMNPNQHKNLRDAAKQLIESLVAEDSSTKHRSVWMKLVAHELREMPSKPPHPSFKNVPERMLISLSRNKY